MMGARVIEWPGPLRPGHSLERRELQFHEIANVFPLLEGEEFRELCEDIEKNGQQQPILTYESKILDGRNRYRACREIGEEPWVERWVGDNPVEAVMSLNLHRRHLTSGQKAMIGVEAEKMLAREAKKRQAHGGTAPGKTLPQKIAEGEKSAKREEGEARSQAAKLVGTNRQYISDAKKLQSEDPESAEAVRRGEISLPKAMEPYRKSKPEPPEQEKPGSAGGEPSVGEILGDEAEKAVWNLDWDVPPEGKEYRNVVKWVDRVMKLDPEKIASYCKDDYEAGRDLEHVHDMLGWFTRYEEALQKRRKELRPVHLRVASQGD